MHPSLRNRLRTAEPPDARQLNRPRQSPHSRRTFRHERRPGDGNSLTQHSSPPPPAPRPPAEPSRQWGGRKEPPETAFPLGALETQEPVDPCPPMPSFPGLFVLLRGGLLLPGLPVALGAIRSSNSST